jgi:hypothetical protein
MTEEENQRINQMFGLPADMKWTLISRVELPPPPPETVLAQWVADIQALLMYLNGLVLSTSAFLRSVGVDSPYDLGSKGIRGHYDRNGVLRSATLADGRVMVLDDTLNP